MKSSVILLAILFIGFAQGGARAQESRTPMLVIHESPAPVQSEKSVEKNIAPAPADPRRSAAKKAAPADAATEGAAASEADSAPAPIVLPGAQSEEQAAAYEQSTVTATTGNPHYDRLVMAAAARHGVDPNLVFAVMRQESGFNPRARSYKGASGLMQLMPATARRFGVTNIWDPAQNIEAGTRYLRFLLDTFNGDVKLALAGYNAGEGAVIKYGYTVPRYRETQNYVRSISARYGRTKHAAARVAQAATAEPVAPSAMTFSGGSSSRLSNNY